MTGLDPVIHAYPFAPSSNIRTSGTAWMPGSSPGMTVSGFHNFFLANRRH